MITCGKSSCNHCEEIFDSKNKFHDYIRSHECVTTFISVAKSIATYKTGLTPLFISETIFNNANNIFSKTSATPSFIYRAILSSSSIYELYKKSYFMIVDLYMRYASLSKPSFIITRIIIVLSIMFIQNLYEKFYDKKKLIIFTNKPFKQHAIRQNLEYAVFERFESIRNLSESSFFSISSRSIAQRLAVQQQRHIKFIKHGALFDICINDVRRHIMLLVDLAVAVKTPARYYTYDIFAEKDMNTSAEHMRCSNKV